MPTLIIHTNVTPAAADRRKILEDASAMIADILGKPESYVMVILRHNQDMLLAGDAAPLAYLELKSLSLPEARTPELSEALCNFLEARFGIAPARVYIEFASPPRHLFGYNGRTF